ncbi:CBN-MAOC-1 protein [Aphelenchoides avenae]|nr:CBN-MAOC-1 protein [Aphelenchus avenae]KAH7722957.1 CBN-MAOC-1 protein [Aphelenchus avenae]
MDPETAKKHRPESALFDFTTRDAIIYALGIGATTQNDLHFLYENHEKFQVFPTFVVAPGLQANSLGSWPGIEFDLQRILHGEQYIEFFEPLPLEGQFRSETRVVDVLDKGSGALFLVNVDTYDNRNNKKVCTQQFGTFQVGSGKFGGPRSSPEERPAPAVPDRKPDRVVEDKTGADQAALYRMGSGDLNPLHVDPEFARLSGFKQPILHGLCSLGFATRQVLREFGGNDGHNLKAVKVRFSSPVVPGQALRTEMWKEGNRIHFQTKAVQLHVTETGKVVLANGYVDLRPTSATETSQAAPAGNAKGLKSKVIFDTIKAELPKQKDVVKKVNAIVQYDITKDGKTAAQFTIDLKNGNGDVYEGTPKNGEKPSVTVTVDDDNFAQIVAGKLDGTKAFMTGKLKAKGNILLLRKLSGVLSGAQKSRI